MNTKPRTLWAFCLITSLFSLRGFAHHPNTILIPHLKRSFTVITDVEIPTVAVIDQVRQERHMMDKICWLTNTKKNDHE